MDTSGNILKDTLYSDYYYPGAWIGGGNVYTDVNGGYFHWGGRDSTPTPFHTSLQYSGNYPFYVAHLDTSFRMDWRVSFPPRFPNTVPGNGYGNILQTIQTKDGGYLVMGNRVGGYVTGWLTKLDSRGKIKWEHTYYKDSTMNGYLVDAEERNEGGFVAVGWTKACATCSQDIWLLSVDSNGCEIPGCSYTPVSVVKGPVTQAIFSVYPNPTTGLIAIEASSDGTLYLSSMQGSRVTEYQVAKGRKQYFLPTTLAPGVYIGQYYSKDSSNAQIVKIVYQP